MIVAKVSEATSIEASNTNDADCNKAYKLSSNYHLLMFLSLSCQSQDKTYEKKQFQLTISPIQLKYFFVVKIVMSWYSKHEITLSCNNLDSMFRVP